MSDNKQLIAKYLPKFQAVLKKKLKKDAEGRRPWSAVIYTRNGLHYVGLYICKAKNGDVVYNMGDTTNRNKAKTITKAEALTISSEQSIKLTYANVSRTIKKLIESGFLIIDNGNIIGSGDEAVAGSPSWYIKTFSYNARANSLQKVDIEIEDIIEYKIVEAVKKIASKLVTSGITVDILKNDVNALYGVSKNGAREKLKGSSKYEALKPYTSIYQYMNSDLHDKLLDVVKVGTTPKDVTSIAIDIAESFSGILKESEISDKFFKSIDSSSAIKSMKAIISEAVNKSLTNRAVSKADSQALETMILNGSFYSTSQSVAYGKNKKPSSSTRITASDIDIKKDLEDTYGIDNGDLLLGVISDAIFTDKGVSAINNILQEAIAVRKKILFESAEASWSKIFAAK